MKDNAKQKPPANEVQPSAYTVSGTSDGGKTVVQKQENKTGMPDNLKNGLENMSGYDLSHVRVHFNSPRPAQLQALAYAQGSEIHMAPGQEKHLPHEGWHVVQQMQGRVRATKQLKAGIPVNDNKGLEREADKMGAIASKNNSDKRTAVAKQPNYGNVVQRLVGFEFETQVILTAGEGDRALQKDQVLLKGQGWTMTIEKAKGKEVVEFKVRAINDQSDPAVLEATMTSLEVFVTMLEELDGPTTMTQLGTLTGFSIEDKFKNTTVHPQGAISAKPQMTSGISLERITNLLQDMSKRGTQLLGGPNKKEEFKGLQSGIKESLGRIDLYAELYNLPKTYQGFIALLSSYLHGTRTMGTPPYFKAAVAALSRADLGKFMAIKDIQERKDQIMKDVLFYAHVKRGDKVFPEGIMHEGQKVEAPITVEQWIQSIIDGADELAWTPQVNQENKPFEMEPVGPGAPGERASGVPIELRGLPSVPLEAWKPFALHLFSYVARLNSEAPEEYQQMQPEAIKEKQGAKLPVISPNEVEVIDHKANVRRMQGFLLFAMNKKSKYPPSWVLDKLVQYIDQTIEQYKRESNEDKFTKSRAAWIVKSAGRFLNDMDTAIEEEELEKI